MSRQRWIPLNNGTTVPNGAKMRYEEAGDRWFYLDTPVDYEIGQHPTVTLDGNQLSVDVGSLTQHEDGTISVEVQSQEQIAARTLLAAQARVAQAAANLTKIAEQYERTQAELDAAMKALNALKE